MEPFNCNIPFNYDSFSSQFDPELEYELFPSLDDCQNNFLESFAGEICQDNPAELPGNPGTESVAGFDPLVSHDSAYGMEPIDRHLLRAYLGAKDYTKIKLSESEIKKIFPKMDPEDKGLISSWIKRLKRQGFAKCATVRRLLDLCYYQLIKEGRIDLNDSIIKYLKVDEITQENINDFKRNIYAKTKISNKNLTKKPAKKKSLAKKKVSSTKKPSRLEDLKSKKIAEKILDPKPKSSSESIAESSKVTPPVAEPGNRKRAREEAPHHVELRSKKKSVQTVQPLEIGPALHLTKNDWQNLWNTKTADDLVQKAYFQSHDSNEKWLKNEELTVLFKAVDSRQKLLILDWVNRMISKDCGFPIYVKHLINSLFQHICIDAVEPAQAFNKVLNLFYVDPAIPLLEMDALSEALIAVHEGSRVAQPVPSSCQAPIYHAPITLTKQNWVDLWMQAPADKLLGGAYAQSGIGKDRLMKNAMPALIKALEKSGHPYVNIILNWINRLVLQDFGFPVIIGRLINYLFQHICVDKIMPSIVFDKALNFHLTSLITQEGIDIFGEVLSLKESEFAKKS